MQQGSYGSGRKMMLVSLMLGGLSMLVTTITHAQTIQHVFKGDASQSRFGQCLSEAGDVDGDGTTDILVGAPFAAHNGAGRGSVHVISGATLRSLLVLWGDSPIDRFGSAVSALGDVNGDGYDDIAVGAPGAGNQGIECGAVAVVSGEWITARAQQRIPESTRYILRVEGTAAGDWLGTSIAAVPDVNGDDVPDLLVGAPGADGTVASQVYLDAGAAYVLSGADGSILRSWHGFAPHVQLGRSVAHAGDVDGDGTSEGLLGGPIGFGDLFPGAALVVALDSGIVLHHLWGHHAHSGFGWSVAGIGDVNGDMCADLAIGSPFWSSDGSVAIGRVDVFSGSDGSLLRIYRGDQHDSRFGAAVAGVGDVDGDHVPDLAIGAPQAGRSRARVLSEGAVDVFSGADGRQVFRCWGLSEGGELGTALGSLNNGSGEGSREILASAPLSDVDALVDAGEVLVLADDSALPSVRAKHENGAGCVSRVADGTGRASGGSWRGRSAPLLRATPNPFRDVTRLELATGLTDGAVRVVSVDGRVVRSLASPKGGAGIVTWDGRDSQGALVTPGIYFVTARRGSRTDALRLVRIR